MLALDGVRLGVRGRGLAQPVECGFGCGHCGAFVDDRGRVSRSADLWDPLPDVTPLWIVVQRLLGRRVDAQGVDAGRARLHLHLAPVDTGLEVQKLTCQKQARLTPVQPQVVGRKADQHRAHAKVQPARSAQLAHAGIHHGVAGAAFAPGLQVRQVDRAGVDAVARAQAVNRTRHVAPFDGRLVFELLHEVTVPAQAAGKAAQRVDQSGVGRGRNARFGGLVHAAHRDGAEGQMGTEPAAALGGSKWAGQGAAVIAAAAIQKAVQRVPGGLLAALWQGRAHGGQAQLGQPGRDCRRQARRRPEGKCRRGLGGVHALGPTGGPASARAQPPHHAGLG